MNMDQLWMLVRTSLTFGAGILVTKGAITADQANTAVGALMALVPVLWGWWTHTQKGVTANPVTAVKDAVTK